jgi:hypothetical protein
MQFFFMVQVYPDMPDAEHKDRSRQSERARNKYEQEKAATGTTLQRQARADKAEIKIIKRPFA